jgi:hypothetical protein
MLLEARALLVLPQPLQLLQQLPPPQPAPL